MRRELLRRNRCRRGWALLRLRLSDFFRSAAGRQTGAGGRGLRESAEPGFFERKPAGRQGAGAEIPAGIVLL